MFYTSLTVVNSIQYVLNGKSQKVDYSSYESFTREMDSFTSIAKQLVGIAPFVVQTDSYSMCSPSHALLLPTLLLHFVSDLQMPFTD